MSTKIDDVVAKYIQIRDKKDALTKEHKAQVAVLDEAMKRIEMFLLQALDAQGVESYNTQSGTAFKTRRSSATVDDWERMLQYVKETDRWDFLEKRVNKTAVQEFRDEFDDLPPGVKWREDTVVQVRRPS